MRTLTLLIESGLVDAAILAPACVGFSLQFGVTNYVNFAYGALLTFAAFMFWAFNTAPAFQLELLPAGIVAAGLASLLALAIGMFYTAYFRRRPQLLYALVVTFAVGIILGGIYKMLWGSSTNIVRYPPGSFAVHGLGSFQLTNLEVVYVAASVLVVMAAFALLQCTMLGKAMRAMSDDRALAAVCGLPITAITNATWAITGFLAGVAGVVLALESHGFDTSLGDSYVYLVITAAVVGGIGRPSGALVGALIVGLTFQLSTLMVSTVVAPAAVFAVLVVVMLVRPSGLLGGAPRSAFSGA